MNCMIDSICFTCFNEFLFQGYAVITIMPNNFGNGWVGFDESSRNVVAAVSSNQPVAVVIRRASTTSLGQLTVSGLFCEYLTYVY